jgi:hypothetical protein
MLRTRPKAHDRIRRGALVLALVCSFLAGSCNSDEGGPLASSDPADAPAGAPPDTSTGVPPDTSAGVPPDTVPVDPQPPPAPPVSYTGLPYGPSSLWYLADVKGETQPFTASQNYINADSIVQQINAARAMGQRLILAMTGGLSEDYTTNGQFDMTKWKNKMDTYNTDTIRAAVAAGVADGTIIGDLLIDEPETKQWGGNLTKAMLDEMAAYVKNIIPTLLVGVNHGPPGYKWRSSERHTKVDYVAYQYAHYITSGDVAAWRDAVLAEARYEGVTPALSLNILNGGAQDRDGTWDCTGQGQAGRGTRAPNCRMTSKQLQDWGKALATYGCFLTMWRYDESYMSEAGNQDAFREIASLVASQPRRSCARP